VREAYGVLGLDDLTVTRHDEAEERRWATEVVHRDGRTWRIEVEARESEARRAESCGKALKPLEWFTTVSPVRSA
jgi:hypothetical protein